MKNILFITLIAVWSSVAVAEIRFNPLNVARVEGVVGVTHDELRDAISAENTAFSNAVLAVGLNIDTNSVSVLNELAATLGGFPIEGTATTVGGLLVALAAAIAWLKKNKLDKTAFADHTENTDNPHKVTAAQVGAVPFVNDNSGTKTAVTIGIRNGRVGIHSLANGNNVTASGYYSHAEGYNTASPGSYTHAEGRETTASGDYSHAEGFRSQTKVNDNFAYSWNGDGTRTEPYLSHGEGTFNVNPAGGLGGFWIGEQTLAAILADAAKNKADRASLALEYSATSAYSVGAIVYHDGNIYQCMTAIADGGEAWNAAHWEMRKLSDFFTKQNSLLTGTIAGKLPYSLVTGGEIQDRSVNKIVANGTALTLIPPSTIAGKIRDFVLRIECTETTTIDWSAFGNCETTGGKSWSDMMLVELGKIYIYRFTDMGGDHLCAAREEISL